jgi:hypothetical protein
VVDSLGSVATAVAATAENDGELVATSAAGAGAGAGGTMVTEERLPVGGGGVGVLVPLSQLATPALELCDDNGYSPLHHAVTSKCGPLVTYLLQCGVYPHTWNDSGYSAVHLCARKKSQDQPVLVALANAGVFLDFADEHGHTALMHAVSSRNKRAWDILLTVGADIRRRVPVSRDCLLHIAVSSLENGQLCDADEMQLMHSLLKLAGEVRLCARHHKALTRTTTAQCTDTHTPASAFHRLCCMVRFISLHFYFSALCRLWAQTPGPTLLALP